LKANADKEIQHIIRNGVLRLKALGKHCKKCNGHCPMFAEVKVIEDELKALREAQG